jgi:HK97 family phage major capsid protein
MRKIVKKETKMATPPSSAAYAMEEFRSAFEAFKVANDQRLSEIEKKQSADVLSLEKVDRIDRAMHEQKAAMDRIKLNSHRPALEAPTGPQASESKQAWGQYMRHGDVSKLLEAKQLSVGSNPDGGFVVPDDTAQQITQLLNDSSPMRQIAEVRQVGSSNFKKPISRGGASVGWTAETAARPETQTPTLDLIAFPAAELYAMPAATQALLDDSFADIDQWLAAEVQDVFAAQETLAFVNGDGLGKPKGFLSYTNSADASQQWGEIGYVATGSAGAFASSDPIDSLIDLIYAPKAVYRPGANFVMNRRTVSAVRKFKDADGNYIWQPATQAGQPSTLLGYAVSEIEDMPDIGASAFAIAFGDFRRGYLIVDRAGVRVVRDPYSSKPFVLFYTTKKVGGGVQDFNAIKLLKFAVS